MKAAGRSGILINLYCHMWEGISHLGWGGGRGRGRGRAPLVKSTDRKQLGHWRSVDQTVKLLLKPLERTAVVGHQVAQISAKPTNSNGGASFGNRVLISAKMSTLSLKSVAARRHHMRSIR